MLIRLTTQTDDYMEEMAIMLKQERSPESLLAKTEDVIGGIGNSVTKYYK